MPSPFADAVAIHDAAMERFRNMLQRYRNGGQVMDAEMHAEIQAKMDADRAFDEAMGRGVAISAPAPTPMPTRRLVIPDPPTDY